MDQGHVLLPRYRTSSDCLTPPPLTCLVEHPRAINYVEFSIITSPYLGPLITAFIVSGATWRWAFWLCTILAGISFVLVFFMDETLFDRSANNKTKTVEATSRWKKLVGIEQAHTLPNRSFAAAVTRPVIAITKFPVFLTIVYYFLNTAWVVGVNTTVSIFLSDSYHFTPRGIGMCASDGSGRIH